MFAANSTRPVFKIELLRVKIIFEPRLFVGKFFFKKVNSGKVNYFLIFGSVMKNKLENIFQCLVMLWEMSLKITY